MLGLLYGRLLVVLLLGRSRLGLRLGGSLWGSLLWHGINRKRVFEHAQQDLSLEECSGE